MYTNRSFKCSLALDGASQEVSESKSLMERKELHKKDGKLQVLSAQRLQGRSQMLKIAFRCFSNALTKIQA